MSKVYNPKKKYELYLDEYCSPDEFDTVENHWEEDAVTDYCRKSFSDWDYPSEMAICIREVGTKKWQTYTVTSYPVPEFEAEKTSGHQEER